MSKTTIKNISKFEISINLPNVRFRRTLKPKQGFLATEEVLDDFTFDPGCRTLVKNGYLTVISENEEAIAQIDMPEKKTTEEVDIAELLTKKTHKELKAVLDDATDALKDAIAKTAIEMNIGDPARSQIIKMYCGVDVLQALALQNKE